ncbi:TPR-like protein [Bimuria novae-zelandiae CBS 107.79]|uniref:TPR-like protein n=1 Tax=Bimuria novae-zelandiae CBS 107.79 TaxID=1447943 RepID=A0A6A5VJG7_9PLEO|nr:TPR-like protein [Bimuria novae-zelandiae CBS 107.79]
MNSRGRPYGQWPARNRGGPFMPVAGTFSDNPAPRPIGYPTPGPIQQPIPQPIPQPIAPNPGHPFFPPQHAYNGPPTIPISNVEFEQAHANYSAAPYEESLNAPLFRNNGPVEEEGFIPAPGHENDHVGAPDTFDGGRYDDYETSTEEDFSDSEDERITAEAALTHDREEDKDFSLSDDDLEDNPEDFLIDDADPSEEDVPKRGKPKTKGVKGGRRGRPSKDGRGGSQTVSRRGRKPGTQGRPKGKVGPRSVADPGPEYRELLRLANEAYSVKDYQVAMSHAKQAIMLNPEIYAAYTLLSQIYSDTGNEADAIGCLMGGAPTLREKSVWYLLLKRIEELDPNEYPAVTQSVKDKLAVACLTSIIGLDSNDWEARSMKLEYEVRRKRYSSCIKLCRKMLQMQPHNTHVLVTMAQMGTENARQTALHLTEIIKFFEFTIAYYVRTDRKNPADSALNFNFLYAYLDLLEKAGRYNYALARLKALSRWIQKRAAETYWDSLEDDREFDFEDVPRRIAVAEFAQQTKKRRGNYGKGLPLEIIIKMGIFRLRMEPPNFDEAMRHLNLLFPEDDSSEESLLWEDSKLFGIVARTLFETGHFKEALRFYDPLRKHDLLQPTLETYTDLYICYKNAGESEKAETVLETLKNWPLPPNDFRDWATLAKFFEDQGMDIEAMQRAEVVFRNRASMLLRNNGFRKYDELRKFFFKERKKAVGRQSTKEKRSRKNTRKLKAATRNEFEFDQEDTIDAVNNIGTTDATNTVDITAERPTLPPLAKRPKKGLFRTKKPLVEKKPQTFMPVEETKTLEGTNVPLEAIDHNVFRQKLRVLAENHKEDVTAARLKHREITASFTRLGELSDAADNGDHSASAEYLSIARELIEEFATFDLFYSDRRQAFQGYFRRLGTGDLWKESALMILAVQANRKEGGQDDIELKERPDTVPEEFHGVHFDKWAEVFCRYALLLAREGAEERCFNVLDVALQSNVFYKSQRYTCDIELCRLSCALAVDDSQQASAAVRYLLKIYPFGTEIFRLYSAANRLCSISDGYSTGATYKVIMRWIKTTDYALLTPENRTWYNFKGADRTQWMSQTLNSGMIDQVKGHDPALFALFGHVLMCTGSYTAALNYFFRAFAITPEDPVLNLSIGVAYFQHALKRLSENRQFQIQQGIAFVTRYHEFRTKDKVAIHEQEAEYNVGRVYHGLGLVSQAIPHYQRCVALSGKVKQEASTQGSDNENVEDFAAEAAYALQSIYILSGDYEGAFEVTMSSLVIE